MSTSLSISSMPTDTALSQPDSPSSAIVISLASTPQTPPQSPVGMGQQQLDTPAPDTQLEELENNQKLFAQHRARVSWGNGNGSWGNSDGTDDPWGTGLQTPKIVSLTPGRSSWTDPGDAIFQWRAKGASGITSHRHIVLYVRSDMHVIFDPIGKRKTSPLAQKNTDIWARTQIIRCLPEAQHANIPGPDFTMDELAARTEAVESNVSSIKRTIKVNAAEIEAIRAKQEPLRAALRALDNERTELSKRNEELDVELKDCGEVQADLRDLEVLVMAFSSV
ncbi:hypothetical protein PM082_021030 [Marasmius tenuissimus]|nr:hypothetical protein PM082_021030 [Marasmius tenuissimus]